MTVKVIHVGVGGWGLDWEQNVVPRVKRVERVAAVDAAPEILEDLQAKVNIDPSICFGSLTEAFDRVDADAVLVTVPLRAHVPVAMAALEAGKHVLVEKPFAPTLQEAHALVAFAEERGLTLAVSQNYRFFPAPLAVRNIVQTGELGTIGSMNVDFRRHVTAAGGGHRHFTLPDPLLVDMAIHHFDLMRFISGQQPLDITCRTWNPSWSPFTDDAAGTSVVRFDGGAVASWRGSWVSPGPTTNWAGEWRVEFSEGEVVWTSRGDRGTPVNDHVTVRPTGGSERSLALPPLELYGRSGSLDAFAAAVEQRIQPHTSGRDNLASLGLSYGAVESAATGRSVTIDL